MAIKKRATKKRASKKSAAKKKVVVANRGVDALQKAKQTVQELRAENRELKAKVRTGERQVAGLLKLLESTDKDVGKYLATRVKDAKAKYAVIVAPKRRRKKRAAKKK